MYRPPVVGGAVGGTLAATGAQPLPLALVALLLLVSGLLLVTRSRRVRRGNG